MGETAISRTIGQTIEELRIALQDYIEATYHLSNPGLVEQRRRLLEQRGIIHQRPYIESTPRYKHAKSFAELGLDQVVLDIYSAVSKSDGDLGIRIHDPPYQHQADSVQLSLLGGKSLMITTGTGSGKTECFLLPILGKIAREAANTGQAFGTSTAMRAMVLYPMNALVNDQLGRLRLLFGDPRIVKKFVNWSGRPVRFARYTSRTPYPGVRTGIKDQNRLAPIGKFYIEALKLAQQTSSPEHKNAALLVRELKNRGKWPAKPDLISWYGEKNTRWHDSRTGDFKRCVTLPEDPELLTRHEVQAAPPDILVTNYSMLEYMLMRPLERPIFDRTRDWLINNPDQTFLLVIDEAHLYRGAAGAEVALLIRRLRMRLGIPSDRLQVICTSASFHNPEKAVAFGAQLTGKEYRDFARVPGDLLLQQDADQGTLRDAEALAAIDLKAFYDSDSDEARLAHASPFLRYRDISSGQTLQRSLYEALKSFPPMAKLINRTMREACPIDSLGVELFRDMPRELADRAVTNLIALGSLARRNSGEPGLLPCRIHSFYRGLAGLWICMDPQCQSLASEERGGPAGSLFGQPRDRCDCGACVLELYYCRNCGATYGRAYTNNLDSPDYLWPEAGRAFRTLMGQVDELAPLDLFLEEPVVGREMIEPADYDLLTGRLNPKNLGPRNRRVFLRKNREALPESKSTPSNTGRGQFCPCAVCGQRAAFGRSSVQDHQTKGDQPFQALIAKQIEVQPPNPVEATSFAPLRGRKILIFSDSRQTAARLAPNLQTYSTQDALRPLIVYGYARLRQSQFLAAHLSLEDLYFGVLLAAKQMGVRLRPELRGGESFFEEQRIVEKAVQSGTLEEDINLIPLWGQLRSFRPPESLLRAIIKVLTDRYYGLESLALASLVEKSEHTEKIRGLPEVPNVAESDESKVALARIWLRCWFRPGFWLNQMPSAWYGREINTRSGKFNAMNRFLKDPEAKTVFLKKWTPTLLDLLAEPKTSTQFLLRGNQLSLEVEGEWAYCRYCRTTQRPFPGRLTCVNCGLSAAMPIDPDQDLVFRARKHYYRASTVNSLKSPPEPPMALIAAEHTAQLNTAPTAEVFSAAEEHELLFQDVNLGSNASGRKFQAIDVLSCTTTMEVGIDIGSLSGVSLRNMPPARANYQQRSGRAGRRGNAVATVTAFGNSDSHDEHYFTHPDQMIRGKVDDPILTLNNLDIARRHVTAYLLQRYHQAKLPDIPPEAQPHLFAVLGTIMDFKDPRKPLNRANLEKWLYSNQTSLKNDVDELLPTEISDNERQELLDNLISGTLEPIDRAINHDDRGSSEQQHNTNSPRLTEVNDDDTVPEMQAEEGEEFPRNDSASENLLDQLFYQGVLPRYAFPTDVATFYVFDRERSTSYRPVFRFSPSRGLGIALSQYAPGKEVWIANKLWTSGAIYSPVQAERYHAWQNRRLYYECQECRFADTTPYDAEAVREVRDCKACGGIETLGPAKQWLRPPGFAHPISIEEGTSPDDQPERSYATRAKLTMPTPSNDSRWNRLNPFIRVYPIREHLLITNQGSRQRGYTYCTKCGLIEPTVLSSGKKLRSAHKKPFPDSKEEVCPGDGVTTGLVLGTDFISDILLISISVNRPVSVAPGLLATDVALRTLSEALTRAACIRLELEAREIQAEYRPALTIRGREGIEAEIYLYDTLPGGAGFSHQIGQLGLTVFEGALHILENCPENCDRSCYRCLRSYKNKFDHDLLDRYVGASLLRHVLYGSHSFDDERIEKSTDVLFQDLERQGLDGVILRRNVPVPIPGAGSPVAPILVSNGNQQKFVVGLHNPLTPSVSSCPELNELKESQTVPTVLLDELVVRRNLPYATSSVLKELQCS